MSRKTQVCEPGAGKMKLLRKVLALQRRKLTDAEAQGDTADAERIERRMVHVEALIDNLEARQ